MRVLGPERRIWHLPALTILEITGDFLCCSYRDVADQYAGGTRVLERRWQKMSKSLIDKFKGGEEIGGGGQHGQVGGTFWRGYGLHHASVARPMTDA